MSRRLLPLSLHGGRGGGFSESREGKRMLPLVRVRIVFCHVFLPLDPLFPWIRILSSTSRDNFGRRNFGFCRRVTVVSAPPPPEFFCCLFLFSMPSGGWRPIIDLSTLNLSVVGTCFFR